VKPYILNSPHYKKVHRGKSYILNIPCYLKLHKCQSTAELKSHSPVLWPSYLGYVTFYTNNELQYISLKPSDRTAVKLFYCLQLQ